VYVVVRIYDLFTQSPFTQAFDRQLSVICGHGHESIKLILTVCNATKAVININSFFDFIVRGIIDYGTLKPTVEFRSN
jgi:hypothetical protein